MNGDPTRSTGRLMPARRLEIVNAMLVDCLSVLAQIARDSSFIVQKMGNEICRPCQNWQP